MTIDRVPHKAMPALGGATILGLAAIVLVISTSAMAQSAALIEELSKSFTLGGKAIPPEVFRDMGDGDLADSKSILITVDLEAAVASNRCADEIHGVADWRVQRSEKGEEEAYRFVGVTSSGLIVVLTRFNGGGSGTFFNLHVLDVRAAKSLDAQGRPYDRIDLTTIQTVPLGDRWSGAIRILGNVIRVTPSAGASANSQAQQLEITARRP
jgi:hypothetical protein